MAKAKAECSGVSTAGPPGVEEPGLLGEAEEWLEKLTVGDCPPQSRPSGYLGCPG